jgi:hypothetical protein
MSVQNDHQVSQSRAEDAWTDYGSDFVLIAEGKPPSRIELARERILICRLYLGLMRSITDDYGAEFAAHSDSLAYRTIGIYVFLRTVMCSPVRASQIAHALKLPRVSVVRRLEEANQARLCGARRQRLSRHGQGEHPRPAEETAVENRHSRGDGEEIG